MPGGRSSSSTGCEHPAAWSSRVWSKETRSALHRRTEDLGREAPPEHFDEHVPSALVLRNGEGVRGGPTRDALLARDRYRVQLDPVPLRVVDDHIEADKVGLDRRAPGDGPGPLAEFARGAYEDIDDLLLAGEAV